MGENNYLEGYAAEIACPNTGEFCPARESVVRLYTEVAQGIDALELESSAVSPKFDNSKMIVELRKIALASVQTDCVGPIDEICPTFEVIRAEATPPAGIKGIKRFLTKTEN